MTNRRFLDWPEWRSRLILALFFPVLNWLMLAPASAFREVREFLPHQDKIGHGVLFLLLASLVRSSLPARDGSGWRQYGVFAALVVYAGSIEALQPVIGGAGRTFDWLDMACNLAGIFGGWLLFGMVRASGSKQAGRTPMIERVCDKTAR